MIFLSLALISAPHPVQDVPNPCRAVQGGFKPIGQQNWITASDYPIVALHAEEQGLVEFYLDVDGTGCVSGCGIEKSSGYPILDEATCKVLTERARFAPGRDANGDAIPIRWRSFIRWVLPDRQPIQQTSWRAHARAIYSEGGKLQSCTSGGDPTRALVAQFCPFSARMAPRHVALLRNGRTGSFAVLMEGAGRYDGEAAISPSNEGVIYGKVTLTFEIDWRGKVSNCRSMDETPEALRGPLVQACQLVGDTYVPRLSAKGKPVSNMGSVAITYTVQDE